MARKYRTAALAALAVLALAGCSRDLELPADLGVPVIRSFSPAAAWGGQWLKLTGSGFDPNPGANRVHFGPGGAATAERPMPTPNSR